jgi:outer membrane lipoprotein-sorting protein
MPKPLPFLAAFLFCLPAYADQAVPADLTPEDKAEVARVETYLNGLTTAKAGFTQEGANGTSTGTFYLSRPGRLRFEYAAPDKDIIVADHNLIWYYDAQTRQANHAPVSRTFADFLLRRTIELTGSDVTITDMQRGENSVQMTLTQASDPGAGSLTLMLENNPMEIHEWRVVDAQGKTTDVKLDHPQFGLALDPSLFKAPDQ